MARRASLPEGKSLFFRSAAAETESKPTAAESPATGSTRQSAVFLEDRHIDWLEDRCREARHNGGRAVRKAAIIRALLDVAIAAPIDLTGLRHEEDLRQRLRHGMRQAIGD